MPKVILDAASIPNLSDGYVGKMLEKALNDVIEDIDDRGHDGQKRSITLKLTFSPNEKKIKIDANVTTKLPAYVPPTTMAKFDRAAGGLAFNPDVADNPDQSTIDDLNDARN